MNNKVLFFYVTKDILVTTVMNINTKKWWSAYMSVEGTDKEHVESVSEVVETLVHSLRESDHISMVYIHHAMRAQTSILLERMIAAIQLTLQKLGIFDVRAKGGGQPGISTYIVEATEDLSCNMLRPTKSNSKVVSGKTSRSKSLGEREIAINDLMGVEYEKTKHEYVGLEYVVAILMRDFNDKNPFFTKELNEELQ